MSIGGIGQNSLPVQVAPEVAKAAKDALQPVEVLAKETPLKPVDDTIVNDGSGWSEEVAFEDGGSAIEALGRVASIPAVAAAQQALQALQGLQGNTDDPTAWVQAAVGLFQAAGQIPALAPQQQQIAQKVQEYLDKLAADPILIRVADKLGVIDQLPLETRAKMVETLSKGLDLKGEEELIARIAKGLLTEGPGMHETLETLEVRRQNQLRAVQAMDDDAVRTLMKGADDSDLFKMDPSVLEALKGKLDGGFTSPEERKMIGRIEKILAVQVKGVSDGGRATQRAAGGVTSP
jgi:hypothetical protein